MEITDIFSYGIHNANSLIALEKLPDNSVNRIFTNPPFGIDFGAKKSNYNRLYENVVDDYNEIPKDQYAEFSDKLIKEVARILTIDGTGLIFSGWTNSHHIRNALDKYNLVTLNVLVWKYQFGVYTTRKFVTSHYDIIFFCKNLKKHYFNKVEKYPEDVLNIMSKGNIDNRLNDVKIILREGTPQSIGKGIKEINKIQKEIKKADLVILRPEDKSEVLPINRVYQRGGQKNATKLPDALVKYFVPFITKKDDIIIDGFVGSSTIPSILWQMNRRKVIGFEISKNIYNMAIKNFNEVKNNDEKI